MVVRNQMDPHFTMNAINSVIGAIHREEKEAAAQSLVYFSRMYRALVLSGDKTTELLRTSSNLREITWSWSDSGSAINSSTASISGQMLTWA